MLRSAFYIWLGLATGNFIAQAFMSQDWSVAIERSFFEALALSMFVYLNKNRFIEIGETVTIKTNINLDKS